MGGKIKEIEMRMCAREIEREKKKEREDTQCVQCLQLVQVEQVVREPPCELVRLEGEDLEAGEAAEVRRQRPGELVVTGMRWRGGRREREWERELKGP